MADEQNVSKTESPKTKARDRQKSGESDWSRRFELGIGAFYVVLLCGVAYELFWKAEIEKVEAKILLFVFLGLLLAPLLIKQLPLLKGFKVFGVEVELREQVVENTKHIEDLKRAMDQHIGHLLSELIEENSLSEAGRRKAQEWKEEEGGKIEP